MKLYLIVLQDKDMADEPDVGLCIVEGNRQGADNRMRELEAEARSAGRCRCVGRVREIERSKGYRATALLRTPDRSR